MFTTFPLNPPTIWLLASCLFWSLRVSVFSKRMLYSFYFYFYYSSSDWNPLRIDLSFFLPASLSLYYLYLFIDVMTFWTFVLLELTIIFYPQAIFFLLVLFIFLNSDTILVFLYVFLMTRSSSFLDSSQLFDKL